MYVPLGIKVHNHVLGSAKGMAVVLVLPLTMYFSLSLTAMFVVVDPK